jgi:hypothetical protein
MSRRQSGSGSPSTSSHGHASTRSAEQSSGPPDRSAAVASNASPKPFELTSVPKIKIESRNDGRIALMPAGQATPPILPLPSPQSRLTNPLDVHTMLNPQPEAPATEQRGTRRKALQLESGPPVKQARHAHSTQSSADTTDPTPTSPSKPRRILTPRSIRSPRSVSLGGHQLINAQQTPFLSGGPYAQDIQAHGVPPVPSLPNIHTATVGLSISPLTTSATGHPMGGPMTSQAGLPRSASHMSSRRPSLAGVGPALSRSTSPSTSYSSYSQQQSPAPQFGRTATQGQQSYPAGFMSHQQGMLQPTYYGAAPPGMEQTGTEHGGPDSRDNYSMMERYAVDIDRVSASKEADKKRQRNANASSRFRARRKERDKQMQDNLSRLENENKQLRDLSLFYRDERNYLRDFVSRTPNLSIPPRAPSPPFAASILSAQQGIIVEGQALAQWPNYGRERSVTMPVSLGERPLIQEYTHGAHSAAPSGMPPSMNTYGNIAPPQPQTSGPSLLNRQPLAPSSNPDYRRPPSNGHPQQLVQRESSPYDPYEASRYDLQRRQQ